MKTTPLSFTSALFKSLLFIVLGFNSGDASLTSGDGRSGRGRVLDNLSCDFDARTFCNWTLTPSDSGSFEQLFNHTTDHRWSNNPSDTVLVLHPSSEQFDEAPKSGSFDNILKSPLFSTGEHYELSFSLNSNFVGNVCVIVLHEAIRTESQILKISGTTTQKWNPYSIKLPRHKRIDVALEVKFDAVHTDHQSHYVALNNLVIVDRNAVNENCEFQCRNRSSELNNNNNNHNNDNSNENNRNWEVNEPENVCLSRDSVCDTVADCPAGDDEEQSCDKLPPASYCNFNENFCNWNNYVNDSSSVGDGEWIHLHENNVGRLGVVFKAQHRFASIVYLRSAQFASIPLYHSLPASKYYKSCKARFSYLFYGSSGDLSLELEPEPLATTAAAAAATTTTATTERASFSSSSVRVWRQFNRKKSPGLKWKNVSVVLPTNIHQPYRLKFGAGQGLPSFTASTQKIAVSIDSFSLSGECFAIDVPESEPRIAPFVPSVPQGGPFAVPTNISLKKFTFTSCGASGRTGPSYSQCENYYLNSSTRAAVFENEALNLNGSQMWTVPQSGHYTIFARGADGGAGLFNQSGGNGALVRATFHLQEGDTLFLLVGQSGADACQPWNVDDCRSAQSSNQNHPSSFTQVGGGGGGGTFVFKFKPGSTQKWAPMLIAGGGGGGSGRLNPDQKYTSNQHGQGFDYYNTPNPGHSSGSGGGWNTSEYGPETHYQSGGSVLLGALGGESCAKLIAKKWQVPGGFGGGGGPCEHGGAGGGFHGGNVNLPSEAGSGGTSFVDASQSSLQLFSKSEHFVAKLFGQNNFATKRDGIVVIVPQIDRCCNGAYYPCVVTGESMDGTTMTQCVCEHNVFMTEHCLYKRPLYLTMLWLTLSLILVIFLLFLFTFIYLHRRNDKNKGSNENGTSNGRSNGADTNLLHSVTDLQLSRLRGSTAVSEHNPNYQLGGSTCTLQDLREISRDKLSLIRALGQGAFGEVYQGVLHKMSGEVTDELPVAVKTLPEYNSSKQAEMDFLMEALIMSKFKHRNIVRFIGVCFEKMPRFIVLELLPGGDLKTFLRENRETSGKRSQLVMGDLLTMALDIALGCQHLEENHFIHRDVAARNCLLSSRTKMPSSVGGKFRLRRRSNSSSTTGGSITPIMFNDRPFDIQDYKNGFNNSGIIAKIADFGMARDIYRADYYRKGGKAMLPVKWMPPEAFLDGVFTSKTDVWSFGVLLWEVMSMGYMPYPGRGNQEVMQMISSGGRLEVPNLSTPPQVYSIMQLCWNSTPELRPSFNVIIDKLCQCLQDPNIIAMKLPVFPRSASVEKELTLMRPPPDITDYLVPNNPGSLTTSNYSIATERTEIVSPESGSMQLATLSSDDKMLELDPNYDPLQHWAKANYIRQQSHPQTPQPQLQHIANIVPGYYSASPLPVQTPNPMYAEVQVAPAGTLRNNNNYPHPNNTKYIAAPAARPTSGVILSPMGLSQAPSSLHSAASAAARGYVNVALHTTQPPQTSPQPLTMMAPSSNVVDAQNLIPFTLSKSPLPNLVEESSIEAAEQETVIV